MLAGYNTRRTSVVLNPRGRVLGGFGRLGENGDGGGEGEGFGYGEGQGAAQGSGAGGTGSEGDYGGGGNTAQQAFQASEKASFQASVEAANVNVAAVAATNAAQKKAGQAVLGLLSMLPGVGIFASVAKALSSLVDGVPKSQAEIDKMFEDARGGAQGNVEVLKQISILKTSVDAASKAGSEAAVVKLYQTYAKRNPDPAALAYWSQRFGPTITADEVLQFQQFLYANEPNLRPVAMTTTASQPGNNLALPIIAAVAAYFVLGA